MYNTDMPRRADLPSRAKLVRSTILAIIAAIILLVSVILPAEYAVDPTGIGRVLGLTEMGEIKQQLAEEAEADEIVVPAVIAVDETSKDPLQAQTDTEIDLSVTVSEPETLMQPTWRDERSLTLAPGEAAEIKLTMKAGEIALYSWTTDRGHLNSDLHADGANKAFVSYRKGRAETNDDGELTADFDGAHGWFWRNRSDEDVEVTLRVSGDYSEIKRVL